jgi:hypothetical protein
MGVTITPTNDDPVATDDSVTSRSMARPCPWTSSVTTPTSGDHSWSWSGGTASKGIVTITGGGPN